MNVLQMTGVWAVSMMMTGVGESDRLLSTMNTATTSVRSLYWELRMLVIHVRICLFRLQIYSVALRGLSDVRVRQVRRIRVCTQDTVLREREALQHQAATERLVETYDLRRKQMLVAVKHIKPHALIILTVNKPMKVCSRRRLRSTDRIVQR